MLIALRNVAVINLVCLSGCVKSAVLPEIRRNGTLFSDVGFVV